MGWNKHQENGIMSLIHLCNIFKKVKYIKACKPSRKPNYFGFVCFAGKDIVSLDSQKQTLHGSFDMKNCHDANHILGMRMLIDELKGLFFLSQEEYVTKVLQHFNMEEGKQLRFHYLHI